MSAFVRKEISACQIRRSARGVPEAMTLAVNIVKFIFKVGDKIRPLTEKKGGFGGDKRANEVVPFGWYRVLESDWAAEEFKATQAAQE